MNDRYLGCSYEEFPKSQASADGMKTLTAHYDARSLNITQGVVYRTVDGKNLHLIVISPKDINGVKSTYPLIVYIQGSAWMKQDITWELAQLSHFARRGYVIAIVEYRHSEWAPFPAQIIDAKFAVQYMTRHAAEYGADAEKLIVWGDSSGGHTACMTCFTKGIDLFTEDGLTEYTPKVLVDYYGPVDIALMNEVPSAQDHIPASSPEGMLIGGKTVTYENSRETVSMNYVSDERRIPPVLMIHGSKDRLVPFEQSVMLYNKLKECGKEADFYCLDGSDHGGPAFWQDDVLDIVDGFIKNHI